MTRKYVGAEFVERATGDDKGDDKGDGEGVGAVGASASGHLVELMVRASCGSCARVAAQIEPVVAAAGARLVLHDVDEAADLAAEFGDRVPVVVIDGEEFACWEVDDDELAAELALPVTTP